VNDAGVVSLTARASGARAVGNWAAFGVPRPTGRTSLSLRVLEEGPVLLGVAVMPQRPDAFIWNRPGVWCVEATDGEWCVDGRGPEDDEALPDDWEGPAAGETVGVALTVGEPCELHVCVRGAWRRVCAVDRDERARRDLHFVVGVKYGSEIRVLRGARALVCHVLRCACLACTQSCTHARASQPRVLTCRVALRLPACCCGAVFDCMCVGSPFLRPCTLKDTLVAREQWGCTHHGSSSAVPCAWADARGPRSVTRSLHGCVPSRRCGWSSVYASSCASFEDTRLACVFNARP
jgi:hypothetical protein